MPINLISAFKFRDKMNAGSVLVLHMLYLLRVYMSVQMRRAQCHHGVVGDFGGQFVLSACGLSGSYFCCKGPAGNAIARVPESTAQP